MASYSFVVPILPGKTEAVRRLSAEASGPRRTEMEEFQRRVGITKQEIWLSLTWRQMMRGDCSKSWLHLISRLIVGTLSS